MAEAGGDVTAAQFARVGDRLRAAREAAGLDLKQLSQRTKVTVRHLEAIEAGDYGQLPGRPYALGFSKSYARAVGLPDGEIAQAVRGELDAMAPAEPVRVIHQYDIGDPVKTPSSRLTWLAAVVALAVMGLGFVAWRSYYWPAAGLPPVTAEPTAAAAPAQPQPAAQPGSPVTFTALDDGVWVKFYDAAGNQLLQKELAKGESYTVPPEANGPQIWTGRPEALAITVGGQAVPKLAEAQMTMKDVPVSAAALLARAQPSALPPAAFAPAPAAARTPRTHAGRTAQAPAEATPVETTPEPAAASTATM